ncbi:hypothetical protein [Actinomadura rugatobispora]|uniref:Peptidoglycan-binding protein n=1 Tax=Actinomadura rugatobispora TaxID=1994 RepID=A0ABW0ZS21_9ACTN|nr:hypothetical protein GCM10010200_036790 [Actinomadura rugatobispora]
MAKLPGQDTEAARKFRALRDAGYDGPIDQDGNKAETGRAAEILKDMRK